MTTYHVFGGSGGLHLPVAFVHRQAPVSLTQSCDPEAIARGAATECTVEAVNNGNQTVPTLVYPDGSAQTNPSVADVKAKLAAIA